MPSIPGIKHKAAAFGVLLFFIAFFAILVLPTGLFFSEAIPDKELHALLFCFIPLLVWFSFNIRIHWQLLLVLSLASVSEWLQLYIPYRDASLEDFIANLIGMSVAYTLLLVGHLLQKWRSKHV